MASDQRGAARGAVIQGSFIGGRFRLPGVTPPPSPVQPRMAGVQPVQPRMPQPNVAQRQPIQPGRVHQQAGSGVNGCIPHRALPTPNAQNRGANPNINQHSAHLLRMAQPKMSPPNVAQRRTAQSQAVQPGNAIRQSQTVQRNANGPAFPVPANLSLFARGGGQPLPGPVRQKMESFFGSSFADVRVHVGPQASSIGARAFTQGSNLYFAQGQYNPHTPQGQEILGHELAHVLQQRAGRVRNPFGSGVAVVQDRAMEAEADRMGRRAASHKSTVQAKLSKSNQALGAKIAVSPFSALSSGVAQPAGCLSSIGESLGACWTSATSCFRTPRRYDALDLDPDDTANTVINVRTGRPPLKMVMEGSSLTDLAYPTTVHGGFISSCALVIFCGDNSFDCYHAKGGLFKPSHGMMNAPTHIYYVYMAMPSDTEEYIEDYRRSAAQFRQSGGGAPLTFQGQTGIKSNVMVDVLSDRQIGPNFGSWTS